MTSFNRRRFLQIAAFSADLGALSACGGFDGGVDAGDLSVGLAAADVPKTDELTQAATQAITPSAPEPRSTADPRSARPSSTGARRFFVLSSVTMTQAPYTLGYAFKQGDVPSGTSVTPSVGEMQVSVKNRWPDGSLKFAVLSGRVDVTADKYVAVSLLVKAPVAAGAALATADLRATGITAAVDCGSFGNVGWAGPEWDTPFQTWISGAQMSSWVYRKAVGNDPHLVAWLEVRLYGGGAVEVLPWIENGYLRVAAPKNKSASFAFTLGGSRRFSAAIDLPHHCRTPLIGETALSYWLSGDPGVTTYHDQLHLQATELVPSYQATVDASAPIVTSLVTTFAPLQSGNISYSQDDMAGAGYSPAIGLLPEYDVLYLTCTSAATYGAVVRNGYSAGRYAVHYRDESTNRPLRLSQYPNLTLADGSGIKDNGSSTINQTTPAPSGTRPPSWDPAHSPSTGYMAYLVTGRWYFMEQVQFVATLHYLWNSDGADRRNGSMGLLLPVPGAVQVRASAWTMRALAHATSATPDADTALRGEFVNSFEQNVTAYYARYVARPNNPFGFLNQGMIYSGSLLRVATWQNDFCVAAFGYAKSLALSANTTVNSKFDAFYAWLAQSVVGRLGTQTDAWYINAAPYTWAVSPSTNADWAGGTGPWYPSWKAMYDATYGAIYAGQPFVGSSEGMLAGEIMPGGTAFWGNLMPAIAYAARHRVSGALAAYDRLTRAKNFSALADEFNAAPVWGVKPTTLMPNWLNGVALNTWIEIPGTTLAGSLAAPGESAADPYAASNRATQAFSGMALREDLCEIIVPASGGHQDSSDNSTRSIGIAGDSPTWQLRNAATGSAQRTADSAYYADGKPSSRHSYWSTHWIPERNRVMAHGSRFVYGRGISFADSNGFNPDTNAWDADNAWHDSPGVVLCREATSGVCWAVGTNGQLWRWAPQIDTWTLTATFPTALTASMVHDPVRDQLFTLSWGDGQASGSGVTAFRITAGGTARTSITFNGSPALSQFQADTPAYAALEYDPQNDRYLYYTGQSGATQRIYVIKPNDTSVWDMSVLALGAGSITPASAGSGGVMNKFRYVPALSGFVLFSSAVNNLYFLKTA